MRYIGVGVLFTCVPVHAIAAVYGDRLPGVEIVPVLTGYIPDRLLGRDVMALPSVLAWRVRTGKTPHR
jgi:hypothetical protein